ncbi:MAG: DUF3106 domain-containing protein [Burkholderiaceae bacterium]
MVAPPLGPCTPARAARFALHWAALALAFVVAIPSVWAQVGAQRAPASAHATAHAAWAQLTPAQRVALAPLAATWPQISEGQKRKWIALSRNFDQLSDAERRRLHERMGEWVALSPADRARARLNFADLRQHPADDRRAKWEAYNALSDEDKRRLAQRVPAPPAGAAVAARPAPEGRLARLPQARPDEKPLPRIAASPEHVAHNTLLPASPVQ